MYDNFNAMSIYTFQFAIILFIGEHIHFNNPQGYRTLTNFFLKRYN